MKDFDPALKDYENIFHDIKTSMSIMYAYIQLLESGLESSNPSFKYVPSIKKSWFSMLKLINHANDQSQMQRGVFAPSFRNYDIVAILEEMTWICTSLAEKKKIKLLFFSDVRQKIMATDRTMLERIVQNLLSNSIKFTRNFGKIELILQDRNNKIALIVRDTGIGIPDSMIEKIFERYQYDKGKENELGSGIGLSIVKEFIWLLEGEIHVSSGCKGTEICIELPVFILEEEPKEKGCALLLDSFNRNSDIAIPLKR